MSGLASGCVGESYTDPKGNTVTRITDKAGRLYQVRDGSKVTTYTYYANGSLQKLAYPNGATEEYTYYANNKLYTLINKQGSSVLEAFGYAYDGAGNMTGKADRKGTTVYTYDKLNRLLTVSEPDSKVTAYTYDEAGNRASEAVTSGSETTRTEYSYNGQNRLLGTHTYVNSEETGGSNYSYDNNGNVLSVIPYTLTAATDQTSGAAIGLSVIGRAGNENSTGAAIYLYDNRNQMIKASEGTNTVESRYNGEGLRVAKTVNGQTSNYLYEYDRIILETDGSNTQIAQNVYGTNLINRVVGNDNLYYLYNGHADVTSLQTAAGTTAAQYYYDAFGTVTEATGDVNNPFLYAGYQYDEETGLYYLKSRMYDTITARFMQEDTYRGKYNDPLSLNLYTYCANNPLIYTDLDGHSFFKKLKKAVTKAISKATTAVKKTTAAVVTKAKATVTAAKAVVAKATAAVTKATNAVKTTATNVVTAAKTAVTSAAKTVQTAAAKSSAAAASSGRAATTSLAASAASSISSKKASESSSSNAKSSSAKSNTASGSNSEKAQIGNTYTTTDHHLGIINEAIIGAAETNSIAERTTQYNLLSKYEKSIESGVKLNPANDAIYNPANVTNMKTTIDTSVQAVKSSLTRGNIALAAVGIGMETYDDVSQLKAAGADNATVKATMATDIGFGAVGAGISLAASAATGAAVGSFFCPVVGTLVGAGVAIGISYFYNSITKGAKQQATNSLANAWR